MRLWSEFRDHVGSLKRNFNGRLTLMVLILCTGQFNFGYDVATFSNITAMRSFQTQFGDINEKTHRPYLQPKWLSLFNSLQNIGMMFGENFLSIGCIP